jgi:glycosyltransferase involved in cell wall biosynthesis
MRIGLDVSNVVTHTRTGVSRYTIELVSALMSQVEVQDHLTLFYKLSRWKHRKDWWCPAGLARRTYYKGWWPPSKDVDLIHGLDCTLPPWRGVKRLATLHDLLVMQAGNSIASAAFQKKRYQLYRAAAAGADAIITVSVTTKQDVTQQLGVPEERVHVVYLGIDQHFGQHRPEAMRQVLRRYQLSPGYLLFVGTISGRKNTARLVQAYAQSRAHTERPLVLVGSMSYRSEDTMTAICQSGLDKHIRLLGYVPDADLPALYAGAGCFVFPTLYEGFGMPILEAMASGIPVVTSNTGAAPEVSGGLAMCVNPYDLEAIADGIDRALETPTSLLARARAYATAFTWARCASQTLALYRSIV